MANALTDARGTLLERSEKLAALMDKKDPKTGKFDWAAEDHESFKALNVEVNDLASEVRDLEEKDAVERATRERIAEYKQPQHPSRHSHGRPGRDGDSLMGGSADDPGIARRHMKSVGELVVDSNEFKGYRGGRTSFAVDFPDLDVKTTLTTAAGFAPANNRGPDVVPYALRKPRVLDLMPSIGTGEANAIKYIEETTHTNNAAAVAEGGTKPESAYVFTERTVTIEVIATTLPVSEQQLSDVPQIRGLIDMMLAEDVARVEEEEILTGSGSTPHLQGFLTKSGVQTQAKGADSTPTAIYKAVTLVRFTGFAEPDGVVFHPNDWQDVRLLQDTTGRYIWGDPWVPGPEMIWGIPVVVTPAETENTALVGSFRAYSYFARRQGLRIEIGFVNDNFAKNLRTIRAESRGALVIRRPAAFAKCTGI